MTPAQFWAVAQAIRAGSLTSREAARLVLVEGVAPGVAAEQAGCLPQAVSRAVGRIRRVHALMAEAYGPPETRSAAGR